MKDLIKRQEEILKAIVRDYIRTGKPVASGKLCKSCGFKLSPASFRIIMAELEKQGYIMQPHTSAGRIPTDKGYRFYVDTLMKLPVLKKNEREDILSLSKLKAPDWDEVIKRTSELISEFTHYTSLIFTPPENETSLRHLEFIPWGRKKVLIVLVTDRIQVKKKIVPLKKSAGPENIASWNEWISRKLLGMEVNDARETFLNEFPFNKEDSLFIKEVVSMLAEVERSIEEPLYFTGNMNVFDQPDLRELEKIKSFFSLLGSKKRLAKILNTYRGNDETRVVIGAENSFSELENFSMVVSPCRISNDFKVFLGVIGPKRMYYPRVISLLDFTSKILSRTLDKILEEGEEGEV